MKPTQELIDSIFREKVLRARAMSPGQKISLGPSLFAMACVMSEAGIRAQHPDADEAEVSRILGRRLGRQTATGRASAPEGSWMTGGDATSVTIDRLNDLSIGYMLVGSFASSLYGSFGTTNHMVFVVDFGESSILDVTGRVGSGVRLDLRFLSETTTDTSWHELSLADDPFKIELFPLSPDPYDQARFRRRARVQILGRDVWALAAEDVIVTGLRWGRSRDEDAVREVITVQGDRIDWEYVHSWADRHGTRTLLDEIRRSIPPI